VGRLEADLPLELTSFSNSAIYVDLPFQRARAAAQPLRIAGQRTAASLDTAAFLLSV